MNIGKTVKIQFLIIFFIIFGLFLLSACDETETKQTGLIKLKGDEADQTGWNVEVSFFDSSVTKAILHARRTRVYNTRMETLLDSGVKVDFLSRYSGRILSTLTSDSARVDDRTKDMLASGHVVVLGDSTKTSLETSTLHWNNKTQKLFTTEFVKITSPKETIMGYGMESDQSLANYKIFKVSGVQR